MYEEKVLPNKVTIFGPPGAGKSTFAVKLAKILNIPCYHVDRYYWQVGWQKKDASLWQATYRELIKKPCWIIEGCAIKSSFMERYAAADVAIYFHPSRIYCLWRMIKRCFLKSSLQDRAEGCNDSWRLPWELICYMWTFDKERMQLLLPTAQKLYPQVRLYIIKTDKELASLLNKFATSTKKLI